MTMDHEGERDRRMPRPVSIVVIATLSLALGVYVFRALAGYLLPHCVSADQLANLRPGMSKVEVIELLGRPRSDVKDADNHGRLSYWKAGLWCSVDVHLDGDDRVQGYQKASVFHDH